MRSIPEFPCLLLALAVASSMALSAQTVPQWEIAPFTRPANGNPVISPLPSSSFLDPILKTPAHWEALHTFNPAAIVRDGKIYVLYRAEDSSGAMEIGGHTSRLGLAESSDGIHFTRRPEPVFYPAPDNQQAREWPGGVEDPRIVESPEGLYVLTYTQWNRETYSVGIATSPDLTHWTKYGPAFFSAENGKYSALKYKSAGIVTRLDPAKGRLLAARINGKYWMYWGEGAIHLATSPDLVHWTPVEDAAGNPIELLRPRPGHFDSSFPETGPPPVLTANGIVVLYNGKNAPADGAAALGPNAYAAGEALFDAHDPTHLLARDEDPVLKPELPYEKTGQYAAGTTFAEGLVFFHKQWFLYYGCADSLVSVVTAPASTAPASAAFFLKNGDTVVFYGDSITEQNLYNQFVELYTDTRFPSLRVHFYGAGVGGDTVAGGRGGPINQRLARDVFPVNPTVVTILLGMNDGRSMPLSGRTETAYETGYTHILKSIRQHLPDARITLLTPSPYDDVTRPPGFPGGYNSVMQRFSAIDQQLAVQFGASVVDLNAPVVAFLETANRADPSAAKLIIPDRVHPRIAAHWVMAEALLKAWNAPSLVSSVTIDAPSARVIGSDNAAITGLEKDGRGLRWTETEYALPLAFLRDDEEQSQLLAWSDLEQQLNQEPLCIANLDAGRFTLKIDDAVIGDFSADQLAHGINLADYSTPMRRQSQEVSWLVRDRDEAAYIHLRMSVRNFHGAAAPGKSDDPGKSDSMDAFEDSLERSIHQAATPRPHRYQLLPAAP